MIYYLIVVGGVLACSASQLLLKKSATQEGRTGIRMMLNWQVAMSYSIMLVTLISNIYCMKNGVLLKDMPILESTGYVFVPLLSFLFLKENIKINNVISILLILIGIFIFYIEDGCVPFCILFYY